MDDMEIGAAINAEIRKYFHGAVMLTDEACELMGRTARELLAKPVATNAEVFKWWVSQPTALPATKAHLVDVILAALTHFAPPRHRMMIEGMSKEELREHLCCPHCCEAAYLLATTPAPEVDADAGAKALAWEFHKAALVEIGAENADDLWASFKDHQRLGWRAVAAREKGNG